MSEESIEKRLVRSQHAVKTFESTRNSWFVAIPKLFLQYNLPDCWDVVDNPPSKFQWKSLVDKHVNDYCVERIKSRVSLYSSLEYLTADEYYPGKRHWRYFCCGSLLFLLSVFILWFIYYVSDIFCKF